MVASTDRDKRRKAERTAMTDTAPSRAALEPATEEPTKPLSDAARRALAEAEARRTADAERPSEVGGRGGLDPARYGDWEVKGIASDF
ncbi:DUF1674 domain-containing protein [Amorphus coralli]|uniref:DUF1674 domain-containing protein n=1 Tax=Amorphus coralli TaxID=340680 RepID=UPI00037490F8